jgi:sugar lactone lactonase YvrE
MTRARHPFAAFLFAACAALLSACGGGQADPPPPPEPGGGPAPTLTITQHPQSLSVTAGQSATFTVAASGTTPIAWQWQRDGADIQGATSTTYTVPATTLADSGATFRAVASNVAGSATSNSATLTVTAAAPVLTITQQPANLTVTAGAQASFTVAATCSSGTLQIQWQRGGVDIPGATAATYAFASVIGDNGAQFRARLDCSGQAATTSNSATLTVNAPGGITLALLPVTGLRAQAQIGGMTAVDQLPDGSYAFVSSHRVKRLAADLLSIVPIAGGQGNGSADGAADVATFNQPRGLAHDANGVIYMADTENHLIRRIGTDGAVTTIAGLAGASGEVDGTGSAARFNRPWGIALGPDGDLYVADIDGARIRRVTTAGVVTTYAGSSVGYADGAPLAAQFQQPASLAVAPNGDVYVAERATHRIRRIVRSGNAAGSVETFAGSGSVTTPGVDAVGTAAGLPVPEGLFIRGNVLSLRDLGGLIRQIDLTTRAVTTLTGSRTLGEGYADGPPGQARFRSLGFGLAPAPNGGMIALDDLAIRSIDAAGNVTTIAAANVFDQTPEGTGVLAQLEFAVAINRSNGLVVDPTNGTVVVAENGSTLRRIASNGAVSLVAGLNGGYHGVVDGVGSAAQTADLGISLATAPNGTLYFGDSYVLRRVATDRTVTTVAGSRTEFGAVDGNAATARFNRLFGLAVGPNGDVFVADAGNAAVRRVDAVGNVTTYAGVLGQGTALIDGPIATARFTGPRQLAFEPGGSLLVVDNGVLRRISADGSQVSTVAGVGGQLLTVAVAADGTIFYADVNGLWSLAPGSSTPSWLIRATGTNTLGSNPTLYGIQSLAILGPKQLVMISGSQLLVATLP